MKLSIANLIIALTLIAAACGGGSTVQTDSPRVTDDDASVGDTTRPEADTVGPEGGTVTSADGLFSIEIPAGALSEAMPIAVEPALPADLGLEDPPITGLIYRLEPTGLQFGSPVTTVRRLSASELGIADDEVPFFHVFQIDDETWQVLSSETSRIGDEVIVRADITHFSWNLTASTAVVFGQEIHVTMMPESFSEPTGQSRVITTNLEFARDLRNQTLGLFPAILIPRGALSEFIALTTLTARATCGDSPGEGTYRYTYIGRASDRSAEFEFVLFVLLLGGMDVEPSEDDFTVSAVGTATCTEGSAQSGTGESTGPPDGSHFVGVTAGDAQGGASYEIETGELVGRHDRTIEVLLITRVVADPFALIVVPDAPTSSDGKSAIAISLYQGVQQGCVGAPSTGLFVTETNALVFDRASAACAQRYDPARDATIIIYLVEEGSIYDFSFQIDPAQFPDTATIEFLDGQGVISLADGQSIPIPEDFDSDRDNTVFDWLIDSGAGLPVASAPPWLITSLEGTVEDVGSGVPDVVARMRFDNPVNPPPDVFDAGIGLRIEGSEDQRIVGAVIFTEGVPSAEFFCSPDINACGSIDVGFTFFEDRTSLEVRISKPAGLRGFDGALFLSASTNYQETEDSGFQFHGFPSSGTQPFSTN